MARFHLHIDAHQASSSFISKACSLGFVRSDFSGHPPEQERYEPVFHLTRKFDEGRDLRKAFVETRALAATSPDFVGYIEGEYIATDILIPEQPWNHDAHIPFRVSLSKLPARRFRESEIHITMSRQSHDELLDGLREMGFFSAYLEKSWGRAVVLTMQGTRRTISEVIPSVHQYIACAGGAIRASLMEERIALWWMSHPNVHLPPVIGFVESAPAS